MTILEQIIKQNPDADFLIADGFDDAIVGFHIIDKKLIYSIEKCIEILCADGMNEMDAIEHFEYNVAGSYVGEKTPIFCYDLW